MTAIAIYEEPRTATIEETIEGAMVKRHDVVCLGWVVEGTEVMAFICDEGRFTAMGSHPRMVPADSIKVWYGPKDAL